MKEFFQSPNSQPFELKENDVFQYGSSDESCHSDHGMISSLPDAEERTNNFTFTPQPHLSHLSSSCSKLEQSVDSSKSNELISPRSSQKSPLPAVNRKKSSSPEQKKLKSCICTDQQLTIYVEAFQQISTESLVSRISALIPTLEKIKIGGVSKINASQSDYNAQYTVDTN